MSMPEIKCTNINKCCAASSLLQSVALEEAGLAHIINAEGEKLQRVINSCDVTFEELMKVNSSVALMMEKITSLEMVLKGKIDAIVPILDECPNYRNEC